MGEEIDGGGCGCKYKMYLDIRDSTHSVPTPRKIASKFLALSKEEKNILTSSQNMEYLHPWVLDKVYWFLQ